MNKALDTLDTLNIRIILVLQLQELLHINNLILHKIIYDGLSIVELANLLNEPILYLCYLLDLYKLDQEILEQILTGDISVIQGYILTKSNNPLQYLNKIKTLTTFELIKKVWSEPHEGVVAL